MLFPLVAAGAGFVLGRRKFLWQMAGITTVIVAAAAFQLIRTGEQVTLDLRALGVLAVVTVASIWLTAWMEGRSLQPEANEREILGEPLTVVRGVMIVPFHWAVGGIQADALRLELGDLKRIHNPRWVVLDLGPAGEVGRRDLSAVERAVEFDHAPRTVRSCWRDCRWTPSGIWTSRNQWSAGSNASPPCRRRSRPACGG